MGGIIRTNKEKGGAQDLRVSSREIPVPPYAFFFALQRCTRPPKNFRGLQFPAINFRKPSPHQ